MLVRIVEDYTPDLYELSTHHRVFQHYKPTTKCLSLISSHTHILLFFTHFENIMPFLSFQQSSWKDGYLLGEQSDDEGSDVFEKSGASLPERRSSIPRLLLICITLVTCYSILISAALTSHMVRSKYAGPNIIYSKLCQHSQTMPG